MDLNDYGEPVMSVLREKYAHLSLLLRKQIDVSFLIDAQMFVNQKGIAWDDVHRKDLKMKTLNYFFKKSLVFFIKNKQCFCCAKL